MPKFGWAAALLIVTVAGCGYDEGEGEGVGEPIEQVSSAISYNGHDYYFFRQYGTYTNARAACPKVSNSVDQYLLARIDTAEENEWIRLQAAKQRGTSNKWWFGYRDFGLEGRWSWEMDYTAIAEWANWAPGHPMNSTGLEDCAQLDTATGKWSAVHCNSFNTLANWVCERVTPNLGETASFPYQANDTNSATRNTTQYSFYLGTNTRITAGTCGITHADSDGDTFLRLFNPNGQEVTYNDDACGGLASNFSYFTGPNTSGTFTIRAGCYGDTACGGDPVVVRVEKP